MNLQKMQLGGKTMNFFGGQFSFFIVEDDAHGPPIVDAILRQWHNIMVL